MSDLGEVGSEEGESLQGESVERDQTVLTQRKGGKWSDMGLSVDEERVFGAKKGVYKRW